MPCATSVRLSDPGVRASSSRMSSPLSRAGARYLVASSLRVPCAVAAARHAARPDESLETTFYICNDRNIAAKLAKDSIRAPAEHNSTHTGRIAMHYASNGATTTGGQVARTAFVALALIVSLFFLWGMANNLNDILIKQFKKAFELSDFQAARAERVLPRLFPCSRPSPASACAASAGQGRAADRPRALRRGRVPVLPGRGVVRLRLVPRCIVRHRQRPRLSRKPRPIRWSPCSVRPRARRDG